MSAQTEESKKKDKPVVKDQESKCSIQEHSEVILSLSSTGRYDDDNNDYREANCSGTPDDPANNSGNPSSSTSPERGRPVSVATPGAFHMDSSSRQPQDQQRRISESIVVVGDQMSNEIDSELFLVQAAQVHDEEEGGQTEWKERASELQQAIDNAPRAQIVHVEAEERKLSRKMRRSQWLWCWLVLVPVVGVAAAVAVSLTRRRESSSETTSTSATTSTTVVLPPTLEIIKKRGFLKCRGTVAEVEVGQGFSIDMCRAIAAALLKDPTKVEMVQMPHSEQFQAIVNGTVDVATDTTAITAERDLYVEGGMTFTQPFLYTGTTFMGVPEYVDCAHRNDVFTGNCRNVRVCVVSKSVQASLLHEVLEGAHSVALPALGDMFHAIAARLQCSIHIGTTGQRKESQGGQLYRSLQNAGQALQQSSLWSHLSCF